MNGHILFTPLETTKNLPFSLIICKFLYRSFTGSFLSSLTWIIVSISDLYCDYLHLNSSRHSPIPKKYTSSYSYHQIFTHSLNLRKNAFYKKVKIMIYNTDLQYRSHVPHYIYYICNMFFNYRLCLFSTPISHRKNSRTEIFLLQINRQQHNDTFNTYQTQ